jgi:hypothetical protein
MKEYKSVVWFLHKEEIEDMMAQYEGWNIFKMFQQNRDEFLIILERPSEK